MASQVKTTVTELPESRVRVEVEVAADEVSRAVEAAAALIGRDLKFPGFRKGKVPAPVVIGRLGREAVVDDAVRERLARWYTSALGESGIAAVGDPEITLGDLPPNTRRSISRSRSACGRWRSSRSGAASRRHGASRRSTDEQIDAQIEQARDRLARLETVERAAASGDFVVVDFTATIDGEPIEGGEGRAQLVELGAGRLIPGFEEGLIGAGAGEQRTLELRFPDDYGASEVAGRDAVFEVTVGRGAREGPARARRRLRDSTRPAWTRSRSSARTSAPGCWRSTSARWRPSFATPSWRPRPRPPRSRCPSRWSKRGRGEAFERSMHTLSHRGVSREAYLQIAGASEEELIAGARPSAERALRARR